jgi:DNA helicase HerA-like ATPase
MHSLICGVTESGKTTLAHSIARGVSKQGQNVIVYDPVGTLTYDGKQSWPANAVIFDDEDLFFAYLNEPHVNHSHVFVDEAGDIFPVGKRENMWVLTRGRHFGFSVYAICQRPKLISPSARSQCSAAYIFRLAEADLDEIGKDFGHSNLKSYTLDKGDFIMLRSGRSSINRANIFQLLKKETL